MDYAIFFMLRFQVVVQFLGDFSGDDFMSQKSGHMLGCSNCLQLWPVNSLSHHI